MASVILYALAYVVLLLSVQVVASGGQDSSNFDFIIVGAGGTGSVIASRLARETNKKILLIEAGRKGTGQRAVGGTDYVAATFKTYPSTGTQILDPTPLTRYDVPIFSDSIRTGAAELRNEWSINASGPFYTQSKVVGGNMATNGLSWLVPLKANFDAWGIPGYTGDDIFEYFRKIENATTTGYPNRGNSGPINIVNQQILDPFLYNFYNSCVKAGYTPGADINSGLDQPGKFGLGQTNTLKGIRQSSSVGYLSLALNRNNLKFWTNVIVTKVLFDSQKKARGVEYVNEQGEKKEVTAKLEVILATGALLTPKILYNSGIGPASILNAFGKPHVVVNEIIGQKIRNHQRYQMIYSDSSKINPTLYATPSVANQYARTGDGFYAGQGAFTAGAKVDPSHPTHDIKISNSFGAGGSPTSVFTQTFPIYATLNYNLYANGTVNLTSHDPLANIVFRANTFLIEEDVVTLAKGILEARRIMSFWPNPNLVEVTPGAQYATVEDLIPVIRAGGGTTCHYAGSVPIGTNPSSPLAPNMLVRGVQRLRVAGPAINPGLVSQGMQALSVVLGEKATDLIKNYHWL